MIRKSIVSFLDFLLFSNLFIAICAMAQGALTYLLLGIPINPVVVSLLACSTLFMYNFSLILSKPKDYKSSSHKRVQWFFSHFRWVLSLSILAFIGAIYLVSTLSLKNLFPFLLIGMLALSYNAPILKKSGLRYGLRNIPGAKLFIVSSVWALSCVWLPIVELNNSGTAISQGTTFLLILKRFFFVLAITLPFDIRDLYQDRQFHLKTIPVLIGKKKALLFCQFLLLMHLVLLFIFAKAINKEILALTLVTFFTGLLIFNTKVKKNDYYYFLFLDGTLLLQFLSVWIVSNSYNL